MSTGAENTDSANIKKLADNERHKYSFYGLGSLIVPEVKTPKTASESHLPEMRFNYLTQIHVNPQKTSIGSLTCLENSFQKIIHQKESHSNIESKLTLDSIKTNMDNGSPFEIDIPKTFRFEKASEFGLSQDFTQNEQLTKSQTLNFKKKQNDRNLSINEPSLFKKVEEKIQSNEILDVEKEETKKPVKAKCTCKKSYCLRLYCDCFSKGLICGVDCACTDCHNSVAYQDIREVMIKETIEKNPLAFSSKYKKLQGEKKILHSRGCNCTKTECLKKYCECYNAGTGCSRLCRCTNCKNDNIEIQDSEIKVYYEKVLRKRRKHSAFIKYLDSKLDPKTQSQNT